MEEQPKEADWSRVSFCFSAFDSFASHACIRLSHQQLFEVTRFP